ncbi:MAG: hypothetical protein AAF828_08595 [Bacteroidota bacterium]
MIDPTPFYQSRKETYRAQSQRLQDRYDQLTWVRLIGFVAGVALVVLLGSVQWYWGGLAALVFIGLFAYGIRLHQGIAERAKHYNHLADVAAGELDALAHRFDRWSKGERFVDPLHPYSGDLDLFGDHSLFQFLNRCVTAKGEERLAAYLLHPQWLDKDEAAVNSRLRSSSIAERQAATQALSATPEWGHEFRALGAELADQPLYQQQLLRWIELPPYVGQSPMLRAARWLIPLFFLLTLYLLFTLPFWQLGLLGLLPVALIMRQHNAELSRLHTYTAQVSEAIQHYSALLAWIEEADWQDPLLLQWQRPLQRAGGAAKALRQLQYATSQLDVRYNAFSALLELSVGWSIQWTAYLEKWRARYRSELPGWFDSLAEVDALVSVANLAFNQRDWSWPAVQEERCIYGVSIGHPLIDPQERVTNDLEMSTDGHIHLVTGSNMAGKSTWLRTVGINIVLALSGAPVCAKSLQLPRLQVWTSMRTQDALAESTSSFFAELKRLKAIIEAVEEPEQEVFFLLDEILKGTNSRDRHTGARALIRQLIQERGAGIIATHDLELAALEKEPGSRVENYAMEVQIKDGQLIFDYLLHRGVSQSFNATMLMAEMGIRIDEKDINLRHE